MEPIAIETKTPEELLTWAGGEFKNVGLASSFGLEDMVLIDMIHKLKVPISIFTLDTGRLHEETYQTMERVRSKYGLPVKVYFPDKDQVENLVREKGLYSFKESVENRKECCRIRKVEPLNRALADLDAWVSGMRREQNPTRTEIQKVEKDAPRDGLVKINPLADWTLKQVEDYIAANKVPTNPLHERNFPSIGCAPCTRPVEPGEDVRAGRWWWENPDHKECGLHRP